MPLFPIFLFSQAGSEQRLDQIEDLQVNVPYTGLVPLGIAGGIG